MSAKVKHPFSTPPPSRLRYLARPAVIGCISASVLASLPAQYMPKIAEPCGAMTLPEGLDSDVAQRLAIGITGFVFGYGATQALNWVRLRMLRKLFTYLGWVTNPKSTKTKVWALLVSLLRGRKPFSTFEFQRLIPNQPLPTLEDTLNTFLDVARTLLSPEDYEATLEIVQEFQNKEGPVLHAHLQKKYETQVSWIADYWMNIAYLSNRQPLAVYNNYIMTSRHENPDITQVDRAACLTYNMAKFEEMLSSERLAPVFIQELVPLCMHGFSFLFNSNRVPGEYIDEIVRYPGNHHIVVICKGQYFKMSLHKTDSQGHDTLLTPHEIKLQYEAIFKMAAAEDISAQPAIASLTAQERNVWAKTRRQLEKLNSQTLEDIDKAMFVLCLEEDTPKDVDDIFKRILTSDGYNRWFDKCFSVSVYANAWCGHNFEHSALDAMMATVLLEHMTLFEEYDGNHVHQHDTETLPEPKRLHWNTKGIEEDLVKSFEANEKLTAEIQAHTTTPEYGKGFMKKQRISPDGYIQMAMQLAFYRMHKHFPKTYEPSTGRMFLLGRTETVHPRSLDSNKWVKMMDDENVKNEDKIATLRSAVKIQTQFRLKATIGQGIDRHLVAMLCASRELGMDMPRLFTEKAFRMPYQLSTSQAPNMFFEYGCKVNYEGSMGGFGPTAPDGYGVGYCVFGEERVNFQITAWNSCKETDAVQFGQHIHQAFLDMKSLFS